MPKEQSLNIYQSFLQTIRFDYFPMQKVTCIDYQLVMWIGQQIGNKICKIGGK